MARGSSQARPGSGEVGPDGRQAGEITLSDLLYDSFRFNLSRQIVGEVRGPEAFDLLQAMNTGHDGSMGTLHANSPREAISRMESMITMGGYGLPSKTIREMIVGSVDVIIQAARLRDELKRLQATELLVADDPMARQGDVEREAGRYGAKGSRISKPDLDNMGPGTDREIPVWQERPKARSTQGLGGQRPKYKGGGGRKRG